MNSTETRKGRYHFKKTWEAPKEIREFIAAKFEGEVLNLCCGNWPCGNVNVDLVAKGSNVNGNAIIEADILNPAFNLNKRFDTVFSDPPWNWPYHFRAALNRTACRHLKEGGIFLLNAPWLPKSYMFNIAEIWVMYSNSGLPRNATLLSMALKKEVKP